MLNQVFKSLLSSYQKKDWLAGPHRDTDYRIAHCIPHSFSVVKSVSYQKMKERLGAPPADPSFGTIMTKISRPVLAFHTSNGF